MVQLESPRKCSWAIGRVVDCTELLIRRLTKIRRFESCLQRIGMKEASGEIPLSRDYDLIS